MTAQTPQAVHSTLVGLETAERRVAFLHGLFGRGKNFTRIASGLLPEAQSLLIDLPNHGQSAWTQELAYAQVADLVAEHLRAGFAVGNPVDLVGHSMGGKVAMVLALRHPELVRRLVVVDIAPVPADAARSEFGHLLSSLASLDLGSLKSRTEAHAQLRDPIPNDTVRGFLLQNLRRADDGSLAWEPNLQLLNDELETIMGFPNMTGHEFTHPVMWVRGSESQYVTDADAPTMRALFPKTRRLTVKGAGHWVHSEKPEEMILALRNFLFS